MAIYHCSAKVISRSAGRSATGAVAYRSGEKIKDMTNKVTHDYTRKGGIAHTEIIAPECTPENLKNRSELWNEVEKIERRKDAQLAREIEVALPVELTREQQIELVQNFASENLVSEGMIADVALHDKGDGNPHAHIMLTMREITQEGFGKKNRTWNTTAKLEEWRKAWELSANNALERAGNPERVDRRTLEAQGIDRRPQIHAGKSPYRKIRNEKIIQDNETREALKDKLEKIDKRLTELAKLRQEIQANENEKEAKPEVSPKEKSASSKLVSMSFEDLQSTLKKLEQEREKSASELAKPVIMRLKETAAVKWKTLRDDHEITIKRRMKLKQEPPKVGIMDKMMGKADEMQESWERSLKAMSNREQQILKEVEQLEADTAKQEVELLEGAKLEYDKQNPIKAEQAKHLRQEMIERQEIAKLERAMEAKYSPGTAGYVGQVKSALRLFQMEQKRGLKGEEIAKKHPKVIEVLNENMERQKRERGMSR